MQNVLEVVRFRPRADVDTEQFKQAALAINDSLQQMPGFIARDFGRSEQGEYFDVVRWQDMNAAKAAAEQVMSCPVCLQYFNLIEQDGIDMQHLQLIAG